MTGSLNRQPGSTAAGVNLDGAPHGFKVTGDAAWDSSSHDYAMFNEAGNLAVERMVLGARRSARMGSPEDHLRDWISATTALIASDGFTEVRDTMVRETIAYALNEVWQQAYGHRFGEEGSPS